MIGMLVNMEGKTPTFSFQNKTIILTLSNQKSCFFPWSKAITDLVIAYGFTQLTSDQDTISLLKYKPLWKLGTLIGFIL